MTNDELVEKVSKELVRQAGFVPDALDSNKWPLWLTKQSKAKCILRAIGLLDGTNMLIPNWRDISEAPKDGSLQIVYLSPREGLPGFVTVCAWHPEVGWCADEVRNVTRFIPLSSIPTPPKKRDETPTDPA